MLPNQTVAHSLSADAVVAAWSNVVIAIWRGPATVPPIETARRLTAGMAVSNPGGIAFLNVLESTLPRPAEEARPLMMQLRGDGYPGVRCAAIVLEGERFHASILRGVLAGLIMLLRPALPVRSFATVAEASAWIAKQLDQAGAPCGSADQLTDALESARAQMTAFAK